MKVTKGQILKLGRRIGVDFTKVPFSEFVLGIKEESRQGNLLAAAKTAQSHLEDSPLYYTNLKNRDSENWIYLPSEVYIKRLPQLDTGKLKAWAVDGEFIRNHIFLDFTSGGNPARYKFVPKGEGWVDHILDYNEQAHTMKHESSEFNDMATGMSYSVAHDRANVKEGKLRNGTIDTGKQYDLARTFYRPSRIEKSEISKTEITKGGIPISKIIYKKHKPRKQYQPSLSKA